MIVVLIVLLVTGGSSNKPSSSNNAATKTGQDAHDQAQAHRVPGDGHESGERRRARCR